MLVRIQVVTSDETDSTALNSSPADNVLVYGAADTIDHHEINFAGLRLIIDEVEAAEGELRGVDETLLDQVRVRGKRQTSWSSTISSVSPRLG